MPFYENGPRIWYLQKWSMKLCYHAMKDMCSLMNMILTCVTTAHKKQHKNTNIKRTKTQRTSAQPQDPNRKRTSAPIDFFLCAHDLVKRQKNYKKISKTQNPNAKRTSHNSKFIFLCAWFYKNKNKLQKNIKTTKSKFQAHTNKLQKKISKPQNLNVKHIAHNSKFIFLCAKILSYILSKRLAKIVKEIGSEKIKVFVRWRWVNVKKIK